ncbi:RloB-like protein [Arachidicoccus rhizosphaerae]|uniref:RloB-like protein n=1 Tax=Arachidicoccus rhizosphaerae TaxID=551991 RepID=A0A1H3VR25_9BACT|nr:RloB family protein [Arachidicoccus rhizosphaerae]SDZ77210.1 RloB-like protein [Arachidicoccus rhizosphaerae]
MAKKRKPGISIFIACEGSNTEPLYFEKLKEVMEDNDDYPYAVTVYPDKDLDKNPKTDAVGLVNVAIERKEEFDELWVVFDKDGYTKHKKAFNLAKENKINVAFSSISFEMWILLHFERNNYSFTKSANIINDKFCDGEKYLEDYAKSGDYNLYPKIQDKNLKAFGNASWLRNWLNSNNPLYTIYEVNPYTDVDSLVKKLLLHDFIYEYREIGQGLIFNDIVIVVNNVNGEYVISITNSTNRNLVWNEFSFYDSAMNKVKITNSIILVGNTSVNNLGQINASPKVFVEFGNLKLEVNGILPFVEAS